MRPAHALVPAAVPVVALVGGLPFANRLEPEVLGMPFLLVWILGWVAATPAFLALAYVIERRATPEDPAAGRGGTREAR